MNTTTFRNRLRRLIFDEDVRIEAITLQRSSGTVEVSSTALIGKTGITEEFNLAFTTYSTYNALVYAIDNIANWTVSKNKALVGTKTTDLALLRATSAETDLIIYAQHYFSDTELDDIRDMGIALWNDTMSLDYVDATVFPESKTVSLLWLTASLALSHRAAQDTVNFYEYQEQGRISSVSLGGDLSITRAVEGAEDSSPLSWDALSKMYHRKWIEYLDRASDYGGAFPEIVEIEKKRVVRETGRVPYSLDEGFPAVRNVAATVLVTDVTVTWSKVYSQQFWYYRIDKDGTEIKREFDSQVNSYTDTGVAIGVHTYTVYALTLNEIVSPVSSVSVTVS